MSRLSVHGFAWILHLDDDDQIILDSVNYLPNSRVLQESTYLRNVSLFKACPTHKIPDRRVSTKHEKSIECNSISNAKVHMPLPSMLNTEIIHLIILRVAELWEMLLSIAFIIFVLNKNLWLHGF